MQPSKETGQSDWVEAERRRRIVGFIGGYLIDDGALTLGDLDRALGVQLRLSTQGRQVRLGEVLIDMGLITEEQLTRALERQQREESEALRRATQDKRSPQD
jgi:hypothetical protein